MTHFFTKVFFVILYSERVLTAGGSDRSLRIWKVADESQLVYQDTSLPTSIPSSGGHPMSHRASIDCAKLLSDQMFLSGGQVWGETGETGGDITLD